MQRFTVNPGQWEGVHAHHPDMLYIHVKGGQWAARSKKEPEHATTITISAEFKKRTIDHS